MIRTIIIDDEKLSRELIKKYLEENSEIELIAECSNGFEGVKSINELKPDLVFLDIQMPKLSGFEMLELIDNFPQIIFSTAYDEFAIKAFEVNAVDYLLKPYTKERFQEAINKISERLRKNISTKEILEDLNENTFDNKIKKIAVNKGGNIVFIDYEDIIFIEAQDDYVRLVTAKGKFLKKRTMKFYEDKLPSSEFVRIHRSSIVRIDKIEKLEKYDKDNYKLVLKDGSKLSVSRSGYNSLKSSLNI